jgi:hypothetical protein
LALLRLIELSSRSASAVQCGIVGRFTYADSQCRPPDPYSTYATRTSTRFLHKHRPDHYTHHPIPSPTLSPTPTPVYAYINASTGNPPGAKIRTIPGGTVIRSYLNNTLVIVYPDTIEQEGLIWAHILVVEDNTEGWILQSLLLVATPAPGW